MRNGKRSRREIKPLPLVNQYYFYDRDTWNPLSDNIISTKRARGFGAFSVSILRIRQRLRIFRYHI